MARRSSRGRTARRLPAVPPPPPPNRPGSPPSAGHLLAWTRLPRPARPRQPPEPTGGVDHVLLALGLRPVNLGVAERLFGLQRARMLALVESTGSHPALADKRERDLPNGVPSNSPPPQSAIANGAHQDWDKHEKSDTSAAEFIKTETELRSASPEAAEGRTSQSPQSAAAAAVVEDDEEAELLAAEAQAAAQLEEEEAAADNGLKAEVDEEEAQIESETQLENIVEEELEEKPVVSPPSANSAEPAETSGTSPADGAAISADLPAEEPSEASSDAAATAEAPMQTEDQPVKPEESAGSPKRRRSDAEKASESDKTEENLPRKKLRRDSDQSALDLSASCKESAETEKRPSLLLSKLQEKQDSSKTRRGSARAENDEAETKSDKIFRSESERAQVLREMRDRVLSSYKSERTPQVQQPNAEFSVLERERLVAEAVEAAACSGKLEDLEKAAQQLQNEIRKLAAEAHAKELEWNQLIRKRKLKEEVFLRIHRRKQVLLLSEGADILDKREKFDSDASEGSDLDGREAPEQNSGEELLSVALRLGSRNLEEYARSVRPGSPRSGPSLGGPSNSRSKSGNGRQLSLLQSQLSKPQDSQVHRPQLLLQRLQRQQRNFLLNNATPPACRLSPSVSLSAIPTTSAPSSGPSSQSGVKCYLPGQGTLLAVDKGGSGVPLNTSSGLAPTPAPIRTRPILPKPISTSGGSVVSMSGGASDSASALSAAAAAAAAAAAGVGAFSDGGGVIGEGRQGPIVDVQSIIADYRSKHPEGVPRRGRRLKPKSAGSEALVSNNSRTGNGGNLLSMSLPTLGCGGHVRTGSLTAIPTAMDLSELGLMLNLGGDSPSSTESSLSGAPTQEAAKDVLMQFAKLMNQAQASVGPNPGQPGSGDALTPRPPPPPYPEVTLHPVLASNPPVVSSAATTPTTSLLHGILTKPTNATTAPPNPAKPTTFSPTLARLLTAPERTSHPNTTHNFGVSHPSVTTTNAGVSLNDLLATAASKARSELTITPVGSATSKSQKSSQGVASRTKSEVVLLDDDEAGGGTANGDDADAEGDDDQRLVIDESAGAESPSKESVPACQSCHTREAEFVCAGCTNQWYCSRDCQVAAWDQHSEVCSL